MARLLKDMDDERALMIWTVYLFALLATVYIGKIVYENQLQEKEEKEEAEDSRHIVARQRY